MERWKTVIIGGGASGLMLSSLLPSSLLLERNSTPGLKLLLTGGGKCNLTHTGTERETVLHYNGKKNFVSPSVYSFPPSSIRKYFSKLGLETVEREDGKVFPSTLSSSSVLSSLLSRCGEIRTNTNVKAIRKEEDIFILNSGKGEMEAENVVFATGGASFSKTGSDGSAYSLLSSLGHSIISPSPALSEILLDEDVSKLEGITLESALLESGSYKAQGSLLFTRRGISGPMVQNLSREVGEGKEITLSLSSFPSSSIKGLKASAKALKQIHLETALPTRLLENTLGWGEKTIGDLSKKDIAEYRDKIERWRTIGSTKGLLDKGYATRGGVDTREIDPKTMESRLVNGLYVIGEALDVDGECGGYNLTFAFASAYSAFLSLTGKKA